jgi:excisionase family DNA binding protein
MPPTWEFSVKNTSINPPVTLRLGHSVTEFCEAFGMGRTLFYKLVKEGSIHVIKAGRRTLVPNRELDAWQTRCPSSATLANLS